MSESLSGSFLFDTQAMAIAERFDAYRALYASGSDVSIGGADFHARVEVQRLGRLVLFERHLNNVVHARSSERVRADGFEHFTLQLVLAGRLVAEVPEGTRAVLPGEIIVFDMNRPQRTRAENAHFLTFSVARDLVEAVSLRSFVLHGTVLSGARAGLLADVMVSFVRRRLADEPGVREAATRLFQQALALALEPGPGPQPREIDSLTRIRLLIENSLGLRALSPEWIALRAGLSRTRLYELFKPLGGISAYIQKRRAARLRTLLLRPETRTRSIAALAFEAGFAAESHANRTFRQQFGVSPGQYRHGGGRPDRAAPAGDDFNSWIRALSP